MSKPLPVIDRSNIEDEEHYFTGPPKIFPTKNFHKKNKFLETTPDLCSDKADLKSENLFKKLQTMSTLKLKNPFGNDIQPSQIIKNKYFEESYDDAEIISHEIEYEEFYLEDRKNKKESYGQKLEKLEDFSSGNKSQIDTILRCLKDLEDGKVSSLLGNFGPRTREASFEQNQSKSLKAETLLKPKNISEFTLLIKHKTALNKLQGKRFS